MLARKLVVSAFGLTCVLAAQSGSFAADVAFVANVKSILVDGWAGNDAGLNKATKSMATALELVPGDYRPSYAWTLVQMKIGNFKQAAGIVSGVVADHPDELGPREAQIWMLAYLKEYQEMPTSIMALAVHLPRPDAEAAPQDTEKEAAKFLGRIFGYFTGPGAGLSPDAKWEQREKLITDNLHPLLLAAFKEGRNEVSKKSPAAAEGAKEQPKSDDKPADPAASVASTGGASTAADPQAAATLKAKFLSDKADIEKKIASLQAEFTKLAGQAQPLAVKIQKAQQDAQAKNYDAQTKKDAGQAAALRRDAVNILNSVAKDVEEFNRLNAEATAKNAEAAKLRQQLNRLTVQFKADAAKLGPAGSSIVSAATPIPADKTPAAAPPVKPSAAATEELTALDGNLPFSVTVQKQRLLESLAK